MNWFKCADSSPDDLPPLLLAPPLPPGLRSASYSGSFRPTIMKTDIVVCLRLPSCAHGDQASLSYVVVVLTRDGCSTGNCRCSGAAQRVTRRLPYSDKYCSVELLNLYCRVRNVQNHVPKSPSVMDFLLVLGDELPNQ